MKNIDLSIVILSFNTKDLLKDCLMSLKSVSNELNFEVIVSDNGSSDGSIEMVEREFTDVKIVKNGKNLGFAKGNNVASAFCKGKYILFLNSDTIVYKDTLKKCFKYLENDRKIGALTCKLKMLGGKLDPDVIRAFPTPWVSLTHLVLHLDKLFPNSKLFAQYRYGFLSLDEIHEVDVIQGAFFFTRKELLDKVGWFDEDFFLDGEDIDLCWKIKSLGNKIIYYPEVSILHLKGASKGNNKNTKNSVPLNLKLKFRLSGVNSMEIFYKKRMWQEYPLLVNIMVVLGINVMKLIRIIKVIIWG
jgi:GT2 family glycosyltransferase